jgi:hypothetical protein
MSHSKLGCVLLTALATSIALAPACMPDDACLRHSDCDDGVPCTEGRCALPEETGGGSGGDGGGGNTSGGSGG